MKRYHSECGLSLHASHWESVERSSMTRATFDRDYRSKRSTGSASRSGQNASTHHRGLRSGVSFTWRPGDTYYRNDP